MPYSNNSNMICKKGRKYNNRQQFLNIVAHVCFFSTVLIPLQVHTSEFVCVAFQPLINEPDRLFYHHHPIKQRINVASTCNIRSHNIGNTLYAKNLKRKSEAAQSINSSSTKRKKQKRKQDVTIYIRFSRAFQRFVAFKCNVGDDCSCSCPHYHCKTGEVVRSYMFLDDAIQSFPHAKLIKLRDVLIENDDEDVNLTIGGMGTTPSRDIIETHDIVPSAEEVKKAYEYLKSLSLNRQRKSLSHSISTISPQRYATHTPESIHRNYDRVMDLLTRGRNRSIYESNQLENILFNITKVGLAFDESDARSLIAEFPQVCLYDIHELEDRVKFMISPELISDQDADCKLHSHFVTFSYLFACKP